MTPERFIYEYPERCLEMIREIGPLARRKGMVGSYALMIAPSLFVIPFERLKGPHDHQGPHPFADHEREPELYRALRRMREEGFLKSTVFQSREPGQWRFTSISKDVNNSRQWKDKHGKHPMHHSCENQINDRTFGDVVDVVRNALAHGNIVYLGSSGFEEPRARVRYLAFLARARGDDPRALRKGYYLVVTEEETFLSFVESWASWLITFPMDDRIAA